MSVTLLRTLTQKSVIGFGKYVDLRVSDLLNMKRKAELIQLYFNLERITFCEEILNELQIPDELRITKPGKSPDSKTAYWNYIKTKELTELTAEERKVNKIQAIKVYKSVQKGKQTALQIVENRTFSRSKLQAKNHGHF